MPEEKEILKALFSMIICKVLGVTEFNINHDVLLCYNSIVSVNICHKVIDIGGEIVEIAKRALKKETSHHLLLRGISTG